MALAGQQSLVDDYRAVLVFDNHALAERGATISVSSEAESGNLVKENLLNPTLDLSYRSGSLSTLLGDSATEVTIVIDFNSPRRMSGMSLHRHNIRTAMKVEVFKQSGATGIADYDSGWTSPIVRAQIGDFQSFSEMPWGLGPTEEQIQRLQAERRLDTPISFGGTYSGIRSARITIDNSDGNNYGIDYFQASLVMFAEWFRPSINMERGWSIAPVDLSEIREVDGGGIRGRRRRTVKVFNFTLEHLTRREAWGDIFLDWIDRYGSLGLVFAWPEPQEREHFYRQSVLGNGLELPDITLTSFDLVGVRGFQIRETT